MNELLNTLINRLVRFVSMMVSGIGFLTVGMFRRVIRRRSGISFNAALVLLLLAILIIPFAMVRAELTDRAVVRGERCKHGVADHILWVGGGGGTARGRNCDR